MTPTEFRTRVAAGSLTAAAGLAALATWLAGPPAAAGLLLGAGVGVADFLWLARGLAAPGPRGRGRLVWTTGARWLVLLAVVGAGLAGGWADPRTLVAGLVVLPAVLIAAGLRAARER